MSTTKRKSKPVATPSPWVAGAPLAGTDWTISSVRNSQSLVAMVIPQPDHSEEANARRIVACVNAMDGIEDPAALRTQRDALLAACKQSLAVFSGKWYPGAPGTSDAITACREAIVLAGETP